jgi:hypothetical protein
MEILIAHECLYDRKRDCISKIYLMAQLVGARATRPFPSLRPQEKEGYGTGIIAYQNRSLASHTLSRKEGLVLCNSAVPHDNWGVLIDRSALCAIDIHSTVGHALHLVQNKVTVLFRLLANCRSCHVTKLTNQLA